jgi:transglutaminase-like putative cysteine protease
MGLTVIRIAVPSTTWFIFPTSSSFSALGEELEFAREVIRTGVAPILPLAGVIAILAAVFWVLGAAVVWGVQRHRPYVAVLAPLVLYLQFATMDRVPSGYWPWIALPILGFALLAVALDRRRAGTGLLTSRASRQAVVRTVPTLAVGSLLVIFVLAVASTNALAGLIPRSGVLEWRAQSGLTGEYYGSVSYNPFVGVRQDLVSQTNVPVFVASVEYSEEDGEPEVPSVYWRLLTLDTFTGTQWYADDPEVSRPEEVDDYEASGQAFQGPTATVTQDVTILALQMDWLPAAYAPQEMTAANQAVDRGFRVKEDDGSLHFDALSYRGMNYTVVSEVPQPDIEVLSRTAEGGLSSLFAAAAEEGDFLPGEEAAGVTPDSHTLPDRERYLSLPDDPDLGAVADLASQQVRGLESDFERAVALEAFFRDSGAFTYSVEVDPGHSAGELAAWLLDPDSPNHRTGYCEQFATSMAVMARQLDIPSRVVLGFTPGTVLDDGRIVVRDRNAHAWVEIWMPSQGWVRFDPTPRSDRINPPALADLPFDVAGYLDLPEPEVPDLETAPLPDPELALDEEFDLGLPPLAAPGEAPVPTPEVPGWVLAAIAAGLLLFGFLPALKWARRRRRLRRLSHGDISAAWQEIVDRLSDLGAGPTFSATPAEFAVATDEAMAPLANVYGASLYGPDVDWIRRGDQVAIATRALTETEERLTTRYSLIQRVISRYRLGSLVPGWWRRLRRRAGGGAVTRVTRG